MKKNKKNIMPSDGKKDNGIASKNKLIWSVLFIVIAAATIFTVIFTNKSFSISSFFGYIKQSNPFWLSLAFISSFGFIFFEGMALRSASKAFSGIKRIGCFVSYSASDIYFSAITPSATGGQPACAYLMIRDGLSGMSVTAILLANLTMYTLALIVIGTAVLILFPGLFISFGLIPKILIISGFVIQCGLMMFFTILLTRKNTLHKICSAVLHIPAKLHLIKNKAEKQEKLSRRMDEYGMCIEVLRGKRKMLLGVFIFNLLQRISYVSTTVFAFLAAGGSYEHIGKLWALQCYAVLGSNSVPIPGAMGVSDYLMLDGFKLIMNAQSAANLELLSRGLSFYVCVILCGVITVIKYLRQKKH